VQADVALAEDVERLSKSRLKAFGRLCGGHCAGLMALCFRLPRRRATFDKVIGRTCANVLVFAQAAQLFRMAGGIIAVLQHAFSQVLRLRCLQSASKAGIEGMGPVLANECVAETSLVQCGARARRTDLS